MQIDDYVPCTDILLCYALKPLSPLGTLHLGGLSNTPLPIVVTSFLFLPGYSLLLGLRFHLRTSMIDLPLS